MKAFRFRLQAVLTLREQAEQAAQQHLARALTVVEQAARRVREAETAIAGCEDLRRQRLAAGARAAELEQYRRYGSLLEERRTLLARELGEAQRKAEAARHQLMEATQRREALDRLRARQRQAQEYAAGREEQKALDDLARRGFALAEAWPQSSPNPNL